MLANLVYLLCLTKQLSGCRNTTMTDVLTYLQILISQCPHRITFKFEIVVVFDAVLIEVKIDAAVLTWLWRCVPKHGESRFTAASKRHNGKGKQQKTTSQKRIDFSHFNAFLLLKSSKPVVLWEFITLKWGNKGNSFYFFWILDPFKSHCLRYWNKAVYTGQ